MTTSLTTETASWLQGFFIGNIEGEHAITMRVLEACPTGQLGYRPNRRARSFAGLVKHIYSRGLDYLSIACPGCGFDMGDDFRAEALSKRELAARCTSQHELLVDGFRSIPCERLVSEVDFNDERFPAILMADWHVVHMVHHRGQLCAYLESMGVATPPIYGGSNKAALT